MISRLIIRSACWSFISYPLYNAINTKTRPNEAAQLRETIGRPHIPTGRPFFFLKMGVGLPPFTEFGC